MTSVYIQGHHCLLQSVIREGRQLKGDPSHLESFLQDAKAIQSEWTALFSDLQSKRVEIKHQLCMWEKCLHQFKKVQIWTSKVEKDFMWHSRILKPYELNTETAILQKLIDEQQNALVTLEEAKPTFNNFISRRKSTFKHSTDQEIETLYLKVQEQGNFLQSRLEKLKDLCACIEHYDSSSAVVEAALLSATEFIDPGNHKDLKLQETKAAVGKLKEAAAVLEQLELQITTSSNYLFLQNYHNEIWVQRELIIALINRLSHNYTLLSEAPNRSNFEKRLGIISKWGEVVPLKINRHYYKPPEYILQLLKGPIKKDLIEKEAHLQKLKSVHLLDEHSERAHVSKEISNAESVFTTISSLHNSREKSLIRILSQKERVILLREQLKKIVKESEHSLDQPLEFSEESTKEIDASIQEIQAMQEDFDKQLESLKSLICDTEEISLAPEAFVCISQRHLFNSLSQNILHCFDLIKALGLRRHSQLSEIKETWCNLLCLLEDLENWLKLREKIASDVDYNAHDLPRKTYLEGIKTFENLKHNFQDDVNVLHNVNSAYHNISRRDLDAKNRLQTRVLSLNDRWHILYKKVVDTIATITCVLETWDEYEQILQHLHLFLTETHIKITGLERSGTLSQDECNSIMNEFVHHEAVLERYQSMANNLKERSKCSAEEIEAQVLEIQKYWLDVYKCVHGYQETISQAMAGNQSKTIEHVDTLLHMEVNFEDSCGVEAITDSGRSQDLAVNSATDLTEQRIQGKIVYECLEDQVDKAELAENGSKIILRTLSETGLGKEQLSDITEPFEVEDDVQAEFVKDLLAALKEAEDRIESLESVLSEPTPSGIEDDSGPNYSRLLAACRSSIDVIQHLNQLLSDNAFDQRFSSEEADIQTRTEGMLNRWEKLENATLNKEFRAVENVKKYQKFSKELKDIEEWLLQTLQAQASPSTVDSDIEKFIVLLQKHETLVKEINEQKMSILTLNAAGQKFLSTNKESLAAISEKLQAVNGHWDKLCSLAIEWQNKLQNDFLQSYEFHNTVSEMEIWLKESQKRINSMVLSDDCCSTLLHEQHTEIFALKQQLESCSHRVKTLLDMSALVFHETGKSETSPSFPDDGFIEVQSKLNSILDICNSLLLECTEKLDFLSKFFMSQKVSKGATSASNSDLQEEGGPTRIKKCCNFLLRVARASFPIQAVLLLLLGAAILLPKEEEEISCRLSNNFASSLNPMLRYPDGPPPV